MDSATQFLLGASVATAMLGPKLGARAVLVGGLVATLPDLDSFLPAANALDSVTYHRGFSHSLFVQTAVSPFIATALHAVFHQISWLRLLVTVWLCLITHSFLDSLTTYGTQIFWPFNVGPPVAIPSVFIIDPFYTSLLLGGIIAFLYLNRGKLISSSKAVNISLAISTVYLGLGFVGHHVVKERAKTHPQLLNAKIHVQPTPFNILFWQVLAVDDKNYYTGATSVLRGCSIVNLKRYPRVSSLNGLIEPTSSVQRFEWFTDGFFSYRQTENGLQISDLRIGFAPFYPFTYQFAKKLASNYQLINPSRVRTQTRSLSYLTRLYDLAKTVPQGCW